MKLAALFLFVAAASLFAVGKYNRLVHVRRRLVNEALMLDFLVRRTLHLLPDAPAADPVRHEIEQLALAGSADPLAQDGAARILAAAEKLGHLMENAGLTDQIPPELNERVTFCRGAIPAYHALLHDPSIALVSWAATRSKALP